MEDLHPLVMLLFPVLISFMDPLSMPLSLFFSFSLSLFLSFDLLSPTLSLLAIIFCSIIILIFVAEGSYKDIHTLRSSYKYAKRWEIQIFILTSLPPASWLKSSPKKVNDDEDLRNQLTI